jgi:hypothetical protein
MRSNEGRQWEQGRAGAACSPAPGQAGRRSPRAAGQCVAILNPPGHDRVRPGSPSTTSASDNQTHRATENADERGRRLLPPHTRWHPITAAAAGGIGLVSRSTRATCSRKCWHANERSGTQAHTVTDDGENVCTTAVAAPGRATRSTARVNLRRCSGQSYTAATKAARLAPEPDGSTP